MAGAVTAWPWPWSPKEETEVWGAFILRAMGKLTDLDRRLHVHLCMTSGPGQLSNLRRFRLPDPAFSVGMRRRMGAREPGDPEDCPETAYGWSPADVSEAQYQRAAREDEDGELGGGGGGGGSCGFSALEVQELLSQGVKPWDEDAAGVLAALQY
jgi:hypothetical protein